MSCFAKQFAKIVSIVPVELFVELKLKMLLY
jgi:hypothetical protein